MDEIAEERRRLVRDALETMCAVYENLRDIEPEVRALISQDLFVARPAYYTKDESGPSRLAGEVEGSRHYREYVVSCEAEVRSVAVDSQKRICIITQKEIADPVVSAECGHVYDRSGLESYFRECKRRKVRCPFAGCTAEIGKEQLGHARGGGARAGT